MMLVNEELAFECNQEMLILYTLVRILIRGDAGNLICTVSHHKRHPYDESNNLDDFPFDNEFTASMEVPCMDICPKLVGAALLWF